MKEKDEAPKVKYLAVAENYGDFYVSSMVYNSPEMAIEDACDGLDLEDDFDAYVVTVYKVTATSKVAAKRKIEYEFDFKNVGE